MCDSIQLRAYRKQTCEELIVKKRFCVVHFHFSVIIILKCSQSNWQSHLVLHHSVLLGL